MKLLTSFLILLEIAVSIDIRLIAANLFNIEDYIKEFQKIEDTCLFDGFCKRRLNFTDNYDNYSADMIDDLLLFHQYHENFLFNKSCLTENQPCGDDWGKCCHNLNCVYVNSESDGQIKDSDEASIGLCSINGSVYSYP